MIASFSSVLFVNLILCREEVFTLIGPDYQKNGANRALLIFRFSIFWLNDLVKIASSTSFNVIVNWTKDCSDTFIFGAIFEHSKTPKITTRNK